MVEAYDRLVAMGYLQSRGGAGFYTAARALRRPRAHPAPSDNHKRNEQLVSLIRRLLEADENTFLAGGPWLPNSWLDETGIRQNLNVLARENGAWPPALAASCSSASTASRIRRSSARAASAEFCSRVASARSRLARLTMPTSLPSRSTGTRLIRRVSSRRAISAIGVASSTATTIGAHHLGRLPSMAPHILRGERRRAGDHCQQM